MTAAAWVILILCVALAVLLIVEEIRLWSSRQHVAELNARLCAAEHHTNADARALALAAEKERLHAAVDLGSELRRATDPKPPGGGQ